MAWKTPVLAGVTETAAGDIESANFCRNRGKREDNDRHTQSRQRATIQKTKHESKCAENFQPREIKRECDTNRPRQNFVIIDVGGELNRIKCLERSSVNEDAGEKKIENSRENTPNTERTNITRQFDIRPSLLDVRCLVHLFFFSHASQPPSSTNTSESCASLRRRRATSRLAL